MIMERVPVLSFPLLIHASVSRAFPGGSVGSGESERDAVYVVSDGVCTRLQGHEQVWGGSQEVP